MELTEQEIFKVANSLPDLPKRPRRNLYDILGVQNKEVINSRVLAYFFNPEEEHSFESLFFDSLVEIIEEKKGSETDVSLFSGAFEVSTEDATIYAEGTDQQNKRIDISIIGEDWSIIIENKLYHQLANPLKAYWEHAKSQTKNVIGIVLSLDAKSEKECNEDDVKFINVTHEELINKVQANLRLSDIEDDTDIFYLREYIRTINTHYWHKMDTPQMNVLVQNLIEQSEAIEKIENGKKQAVAFIDRQIQEVFTAKGYEKNKQWFCHPEDENLCFYVASSYDILKSNSLRFSFEVFNDLKKAIGDEGIKMIHKALKDQNLGDDFYFDSKYDTSNMSRIITFRKFDFFSDGTDIKSGLEKILDTYFFNSGGIEETTLKFFPETMALKKAKAYSE
jgi:hypothetical protein